MKTVAILLAAGEGARTNLSVPKQLFPIGKKKLFEYALETMLTSCQYERVLIVVSEKSHTTIQKYVEQLKKIPNNNIIEIVLGGVTRHESIKKALTNIVDQKILCDLVIFQDAARPFVTKKEYSSILLSASKAGNDGAIIVEPVRGLAISSESEKVLTIGKNIRYVTHMPECYKFRILIELYKKKLKKSSSMTNLELMVRYHKIIAPIVSCKNNLKITFPEDVKFARDLLSRSK